MTLSSRSAQRRPPRDPTWVYVLALVGVLCGLLGLGLAIAHFYGLR